MPNWSVLFLCDDIGGVRRRDLTEKGPFELAKSLTNALPEGLAKDGESFLDVPETGKRWVLPPSFLSRLEEKGRTMPEIKWGPPSFQKRGESPFFLFTHTDFSG